MNIASVAAIQARMSAIESRFAQLDALRGAVRPNGVTGSASFEGSLRSALGLDAVLSRPDAAPSAAPTSTGTLASGATVAGTAPASPGLTGDIAPGTPFATEFAAAGARHGVPPKLLASVGWVESRYQVDAVSPAGAIGLMQIMPMTAHELGVDPTDPIDAIDGAARLLASHFERFGSWDLAVAAYHSGGGAISRAGDTLPPRAAEYVRRVNERLEHA